MNSPCGHKEATCIIGNYWECIVCDTPKQIVCSTPKQEERETHTNYGCDMWGWNCGSPACRYPHKFNIGDRVIFTKSNTRKLIVGAVIKYHKHSNLSNQKCQTVLWDDGGRGDMLDHDIELYKGPNWARILEEEEEEKEARRALGLT